MSITGILHELPALFEPEYLADTLLPSMKITKESCIFHVYQYFPQIIDTNNETKPKRKVVMGENVIESVHELHCCI